MKIPTNEIVAGAITALTLTAVATCRFSEQTKREIMRRDGEYCQDCGTTENLTFHHVIPEFFLREEGINPNKAIFGVCVCRACHDKRDHDLLMQEPYRSRLNARSHHRERSAS